MIRSLFKRTRRFAREEDGNASVEFVLVFPIYLSIMLMSIELGFVTLRSVMLERGMDMAVRDIRLGSSELLADGKVQHKEVIDAVCENALILLDCESSLLLEMAPSESGAIFGAATNAVVSVSCTPDAFHGCVPSMFTRVAVIWVPVKRSSRNVSRAAPSVVIARS